MPNCVTSKKLSEHNLRYIMVKVSQLTDIVMAVLILLWFKDWLKDTDFSLPHIYWCYSCQSALLYLIITYVCKLMDCLKNSVCNNSVTNCVFHVSGLQLQIVFKYLSLFMYNSCQPPSTWFTITVSCEHLQLINTQLINFVVADKGIGKGNNRVCSNHRCQNIRWFMSIKVVSWTDKEYFYSSTTCIFSLPYTRTKFY